MTNSISGFYVLLTVHLDLFLLKKNQPDAHFIFSIFRQKPLHIPGVSTANNEEVKIMEGL